MPRKAINPIGSASVGPYSPGIDSGEFIFLSGQIPINSETGKLVEGDIKVQTEQCFKNCLNILNAAGLSFDDVVKVSVFLIDINEFNGMNSVYETKFSPPYPARTTIGVTALPLGAKVEIEMIAKRR